MMNLGNILERAVTFVFMLPLISGQSPSRRTLPNTRTFEEKETFFILFLNMVTICYLRRNNTSKTWLNLRKTTFFLFYYSILLF